MIFDRLKKRKAITGFDERGELFDIEITKGEAVSDDAFFELSNGKGNDDVE